MFPDPQDMDGATMEVSNFDFGEPSEFMTVRIHNGSDVTSFAVHAEAFFYHAEAFDYPPDKEIDIHDTEVETFGIFLRWLYTQKLDKESGQELTLLEVGKIFAFAEERCVSILSDALQKAIPGRIRKLEAKGMTKELSEFYAYALKCPTWGLCEIAVNDIVVGKKNSSAIDDMFGEIEKRGELSKTFATNLLRKYEELHSQSVSLWKKHNEGQKLPEWLLH